MAKSKKVFTDLKQHWVCEDCGRPNIGKDPPDECVFCAHKYFDNLHDMVARTERGNKGVVA